LFHFYSTPAEKGVVIISPKFGRIRQTTRRGSQEKKKMSTIKRRMHITRR